MIEVVRFAQYIVNNIIEATKWFCLSIHREVPAGAKGSSVRCNGQTLCKFTSKTSHGATTINFDDLNPNGVSGVNGSIAFFALAKNTVVLESDIELHHRVCYKNWYQIDYNNYF